MSAVHIDGAWVDPETHQPIRHDARGVARVLPLRTLVAANDRGIRAAHAQTPASGGR